MAQSPKVKTLVAVGLWILGIGLIVGGAFIELTAEGSDWKWAKGDGLRLALLAPSDLIASALLLLVGARLLARLTGDSFGNVTVSLPRWMGVYYFAFGIAAFVGTTVWWLLGCLVFVGATAALVYWAFDASGLGCVLGVPLVAVVRVAAIAADALILRTILPPS